MFEEGLILSNNDNILEEKVNFFNNFYTNPKRDLWRIESLDWFLIYAYSIIDGLIMSETF